MGVETPETQAPDASLEDGLKVVGLEQFPAQVIAYSGAHAGQRLFALCAA